MSDKMSVAKTIALPLALMNRIADRANAQDKKVNTVIREVLEKEFGGEVV